MKQVTIIVFIILTGLSSHSQKWGNLIGVPGREDFPMNILEHYDGGYLISGNIYWGGDNSHGWLIKTDINGQVIWDKVITTLPSKALISKTLFDSTGNIYIFGWLLQNQPHEFPFVVKLDACGELLWCRMLAIEGYEYGFTTDALFLENGDLLSLVFLTDPDYKKMVFLFRMSSDGDLIWQKEYASLDNHPYYGTRIGQSIKMLGDLIVITGYVYSPYPNSPNPYHVYQRPMFIGIDENFEEKWIVEFGINDSLLGRAETVVPINDTLFMGVGRYRYVDETGMLTASAWMMFFNINGIQVGHKILPDEQFGLDFLGSAIIEVEHIADDKYFLASNFMYADENFYINGEIIVDTSGSVFNNAIRENTWGGSIYQVKTFDKKYTLTTNYKLPSQTKHDIYLYKINENLEHDTLYPGNYTYDSLCPYAIQSGVIDLAGCGVITSIGEIPTLEEYRKNMAKINITAIPNPSSTGEVVLEFENTSSFINMELRVFDAFGREIHSETVYPHQGALRLDVGHWPHGLYLAVIYSNGGAVGRCKVVVE